MIDGEESLIARGRSGDRAAFEEIVRRHARSVYCRIYLNVGDAHRAEDLTQETFLRAWQKMSSLTNAKSFHGWLAAIAHGVIADATRHRSRKKRGWLKTKSDTDELYDLPDRAQAAPEALELSEQRERALEALRSLPSEYQAVLTLRYIAGADYDQIARQLSISNGSLRGLLSRGLQMMREKMQTAERSS